MSVQENLRRLTERPGQTFRSVKVLEVKGVGDGSTVVASDGVVEDTYPCSSGYLTRAVGDKVLALQMPGGAWLVAVALNVAAAIPALTEARVLQMIEQAGRATKLSYGNSAPSGSDWETGTLRVRVLDEVNEFHVQTAAPPAAPPAAHAGRPPDDDFTNATGAGSWRTSGSQTDSAVKAGSWTGADWYGAWFFTDRIEDICSAGTVDELTITVSRPHSRSGWNRGVPLRFGLHDKQNESRPTLTDKWDGPSISKGATVTATIPGPQAALLASGAKRGIGISGSGRGDYVQLSSSARLDVSFTS